VIPPGSVATIDVAVDEVTTRLMLSRVTVGPDKLLPVIVNVWAVKFATALSTAGAFAKATCAVAENASTATTSVILERDLRFDFFTGGVVAFWS
jgi:hypothetical protein